MAVRIPAEAGGRGRAGHGPVAAERGGDLVPGVRTGVVSGVEQLHPLLRRPAQTLHPPRLVAAGRRTGRRAGYGGPSGVHAAGDGRPGPLVQPARLLAPGLRASRRVARASRPYRGSDGRRTLRRPADLDEHRDGPGPRRWTPAVREHERRHRHAGRQPRVCGRRGTGGRLLHPPGPPPRAPGAAGAALRPARRPRRRHRSRAVAPASGRRAVGGGREAWGGRWRGGG